jgi:hypothetical protein
VTKHSARSAGDNIPRAHRSSAKSGDPGGDALTIEVVEPLCRICRDPAVRRLVNRLLDWRGVPIPGGGTITHRTILGWLDPINAGRDKRDQITYDSLWVHSKRHHELAGIVAYWSARLDKELRDALRQMGA